MIRQRLQNASINIGVLAVSSLAGAREFITADPPVRQPETIWPGIWVWLQSPTNVVILVSASFAVLSGYGTIKQLFFDPATASESLVKRLWNQINRNFARADERQGLRHGESMGGHTRTQAEIAALTEAIAELTARVGQSDPQAAGLMGTELGKLARSASPADNAIAQTAVEGDYDAAYAALIAEAEAGKRRDAERYRQAARVIAPFAPSKALEAYKEATDLDPEDFVSWIELGRLRFHYDSLASARTCFQNALQRVSGERDRSVIHTDFGDLLLSEGALGEARSEYAAGLAIDARLAKADPGNAEWQRDLSISYNKLGDVEVAAGNLAAARQRFEAGLAIRARLAQAEPGNAGWQRDLSVGYDKLGAIEVASGNLAAARQRFEASLAIRERLAQAEPGNAGWQRDLSISYNRLGDVEVAAGNLAAARLRFEAGLVIAERLASAEPGNTEWQRDLSISYNKLGDVEVTAGNLAAARKRFEAGLVIRERLASAEPGNAGWQRDLSVSYNRLGDVEVTAGNLAAARQRIEAGLVIADRLASAEPGNAEWQRDLSVSYDKLGNVEVAAGNLAAARQRFEAGLANAERLVRQWPDHPQFQADRMHFERRLEQLG